MAKQNDDLRLRLYQAICRYCNGVLRRYSRGFAQMHEDFAHQAWVEVCDDPKEGPLALAELETHDRLAPCVKKRIRRLFDRQKRYWQRTRPLERQDLLTQPNWRSDPLAKEHQWERVLAACSPRDRGLLGLDPVRRTQREEADSQRITVRTFRNRRDRLLARLESDLNRE